MSSDSLQPIEQPWLVTAKVIRSRKVGICSTAQGICWPFTRICAFCFLTIGILLTHGCELEIRLSVVGHLLK